MIDDFDDLVDPCTLALHCLGLEPTVDILRTIEIEEKKSKYFTWLVIVSPFPLFFLTSVFLLQR